MVHGLSRISQYCILVIYNSISSQQWLLSTNNIILAVHYGQHFHRFTYKYVWGPLNGKSESCSLQTMTKLVNSFHDNVCLTASVGRYEVLFIVELAYSQTQNGISLSLFPIIKCQPSLQSIDEVLKPLENRKMVSWVGIFIYFANSGNRFRTSDIFLHLSICDGNRHDGEYCYDGVVPYIHTQIHIQCGHSSISEKISSIRRVPRRSVLGYIQLCVFCISV